MVSVQVVDAKGVRNVPLYTKTHVERGRHVREALDDILVLAAVAEFPGEALDVLASVSVTKRRAVDDDRLIAVDQTFDLALTK